MAARRAFDVTELLEKILLDVDIQTLFTAQRVDKSFHDTINGSIQLQAALFLRVKPPTSGENPVQNPLFYDVRTRGQFGIDWFFYDRETRQSFLYLALVAELKTLPSSGSWRRMPLSQPALLGEESKWWIRYDCGWCLGCLNGHGYERFKITDSLTMGDALRRVMDRAESEGACGAVGE